jgi:hypothetical protein
VPCVEAEEEVTWALAGVPAIEQNVSMHTAAKQTLRDRRLQWAFMRDRWLRFMLLKRAKVTNSSMGISFFAFDRK